MTCSCPKCAAPVEVDPASIHSDGLFNNCPDCKANFLIRKESFAKRALYKGTDIHCAECGNHTGPSIYCQNCHAIYPDFLVIESTSVAKRRIDKFVASLLALKNMKLGGTAKISSDKFSSTTAAPKKSKSFNLFGHSTQIAAVIVLVIIIFAGAGVYYWRQDKITTEYSENYIRTLLGIKSARDLELKISARQIANMKIGASSSLTAAEQKSVKSAKLDVDTLMKRFGNVPERFTQSHGAINKLNESYTKLYLIVAEPAGTSDAYSAAIKQIDDEFIKNAGELKAVMPKKISAMLAESRKKYKPFQDF